eukprot:6481210-Amphidinium_carterae.4
MTKAALAAVLALPILCIRPAPPFVPLALPSPRSRTKGQFAREHAPFANCQHARLLSFSGRTGNASPSATRALCCPPAAL